MDALRDYGQDTEAAKQFFREFTYVDEEGDQVHKYVQKLARLANREERLMVIEMADVEKYDPSLAKHISGNTVRYTQIFYAALDELLPAYKTHENTDKDVMDVFIDQRIRNLAKMSQSKENRRPAGNTASQNATGPAQDVDDQYPPELIRRAEISFKPSSLKSTPIREVKSEHIGKLVTVRGIVTRVTDVKPKLAIACYSCQQCGCESFQAVSGYEFTPLFECTSAICKTNKTLGRLTFRTRGSKFVKYQEIKLQEHSDQVPVGHIPRMATIMAHGEQTRNCTPGDHISVSGVFLTIEKSGFRLRSGGLSAETYIESHYITQMNKTEDDEIDNEPMAEEEAKALMDQHPDFLSYVSGGLAPEIFGHTELKKALLLLLVGGVDRSPDGMKIRGNINICLMGDPGVAKSQMLGFIDRLAPRSQYTTGRGSSGVGLTAAVMKDPITNELSLEGGALVLADRGICCIDEFDKMMDADRTAIHEVMEQQTVSIAKAGIMTTLNARVSILAAANPAYGRYNGNKSVSENLQLPPALLSRFDLIWLIRDIAVKESDLELSSHVTHIHLDPTKMRTFDNIMSMKDMRRYINLCKKKNPTVPASLAQQFINIYLRIRAEKRDSEKYGTDKRESMFTSPRSLLAIIRMSTALARLRLADQVEQIDIQNARELYNCSRESIQAAGSGPAPVLHIILEYIDELLKRDGGRVCPIEDLKKRACEYSSDQIHEYLRNLNVSGAIGLRDDDIIRL